MFQVTSLLLANHSALIQSHTGIVYYYYVASSVSCTYIETSSELSF